MAKDNSTLLILGALGVGGYFAYTQGMLDDLLVKFGIQPHGKPGTTAKQNAPPALGKVADTAGIAKQVAAQDPYIIPSVASVSQPPTGYASIHVKDKSAAPVGVIYLRSDIAGKTLDAANQAIPVLNLQAKALWDGRLAINPDTAGAMPEPLPFLTLDTLSLNDLKSIVGLSGLGEYRRHVYTRTGRYA